VRLILKVNLNPWLKKSSCIGKIEGKYIAMEDAVLVWPADQSVARRRFDERPLQLLIEKL